MSATVETIVIGFGLVGAVIAGNAAAKAAQSAGCTDNQQLAAGCVGAGLAVAVLPCAAVAGIAITAKAGYELATSPSKRDALRAKLDDAAEQTKAKCSELRAKAHGMTTVKPAATKPTKPTQRTRARA